MKSRKHRIPRNEPLPASVLGSLRSIDPNSPEGQEIAQQAIQDLEHCREKNALSGERFFKSQFQVKEPESALSLEERLERDADLKAGVEAQKRYNAREEELRSYQEDLRAQIASLNSRLASRDKALEDARNRLGRKEAEIVLLKDEAAQALRVAAPNPEQEAEIARLKARVAELEDPEAAFTAALVERVSASLEDAIRNNATGSSKKRWTTQIARLTRHLNDAQAELAELRNHGSTSVALKHRERFLAHIKTSKGCWEWTGGVDHSGFPQFNYCSRVMHGQRFAYLAFVGEIPPKLVVHRNCDNKLCCRPSHLAVITRGEMQKIARAKHLADPNYKPKGKKRSAWHKLNYDKAAAIRLRHEKGESASALSREYGVNRSTVERVLRGETWINPPPTE